MKAKPGENIVRSFNISVGLLGEIDRVVEGVTAQSGLPFDRSKLLSVFAELLTESGRCLNFEGVKSYGEIKYRLVLAFASCLGEEAEEKVHRAAEGHAPKRNRK